MPKSMTDDQLAAKAARQRECKAAAAKLLAEASELQDELIAEVARRRSKIKTSKGREVAGVALGALRVMVLSNPTTTYDVDRARARLGDRRFRKLAHWAIAKKAVESALAAGELTEEERDGFADVRPSAPWVAVYGS